MQHLEVSSHAAKLAKITRSSDIDQPVVSMCSLYHTDYCNDIDITAEESLEDYRKTVQAICC